MNTNVDKMKYCLRKSAPDLFLAGGVAAIIGGGLLAIRQTPKAVKILERMEDESRTEKTKAIAPLYLPSIGLVAIGVTSVVWSINITNRKLAAMTTAYTMSDTAFKVYRKKVKEYVDPSTSDVIDEQVARETINRNPVGSREVYIQPKGDVLIYDNSSGRYFKGSLVEVEKAINVLNKRMRSEMTVTLNDFYNEIGLDPIKTGEYIGWHIDKDEIEIYTSAGIAEDSQPYISLELLGFTSI